MSHQGGGWSPQESAAVAAVVRHHAQLANDLDRRTDTLLALVDAGPRSEVESARRILLDFLRHELVPHARAEEDTLYPAAAALPAGALLIEGMLGEHKAIMALVDELAAASSPVRAAAAGRALAALFAVHLAKENDLALPLVADREDVSLANLLDGMHALLGEAPHGHHAAAHGEGRGVS